MTDDFVARDLADLRGYYEEEARQQLRKPVRGIRVDLRHEFIELLKAEGRTSVIDFGSGPGGDGQAFVDAGLRYVGLDLAHGNAVLAARADLTVLHGSIDAPPVRDGWFEAGWSMSALMHLRDAHAAKAIVEMGRTLEPGAPFHVGLWGGSGDYMVNTDIEGHRRQYDHRTFERNREMLSSIGTVEMAEVLDLGSDYENYQVFRIRLSG